LAETYTDWVRSHGKILNAFVNGDRGWLMYRVDEDDAGYSSRDPTYAGPEKEKDYRYFILMSFGFSIDYIICSLLDTSTTTISSSALVDSTLVFR
jgi:hypothetical protein